MGICMKHGWYMKGTQCGLQHGTTFIPVTVKRWRHESGLWGYTFTLQWRHYGCDGVQSPSSRLLINRLFRRRSKKISKLRVTGLCEGNSPATGEFPTQRASNAENVSIWWRHRVCVFFLINKLVWMTTTNSNGSWTENGLRRNESELGRPVTRQ